MGCQRTTHLPSPYVATEWQAPIALSVWYSLDLTHPDNVPYYRPGQELPRLLLEGVRKGVVCAYADEELRKPLYWQGTQRWLGESLGGSDVRELSRIALKRNMLYDPNRLHWERSYPNVRDLYEATPPRLEHSVIALYPAAKHSNQKPLYFSMYEVARHVLAANPKSAYSNPYDPVQVINFFDALEFRLYCGKIIGYQLADASYPTAVRKPSDLAPLHKKYAAYPHFARVLIYYETFHWKNAYVAYRNAKS